MFLVCILWYNKNKEVIYISNKLVDATKEKSSVSARVNKHVVDIYKDKDIPISLVIETSLIYFLKLSDKEKIKFISQNIPENVTLEDLKVPKIKWKSLLQSYLKQMALPNSVTNSLFTGLAMGAITILGGLFTAVGSLDDEDFNNLFNNTDDEE